MDQVILVSFDIENGKEVVDALDRDGKTPNVALWKSFRITRIGG